MSGKFITSAELLATAGISKKSSEKIPLEHRHLLITAVLDCVPEHKLRALLINKGFDVSFRDVGTWMQNTREWLGLPPIGRGKPSAEYLSEIAKWRDENGNPTAEQIDAGWVPEARRKEEKEIRASKLSPKYRAMLKEFHEMVTSFDGLDDAEIGNLCEKYVLKIKSELSELPPQSELLALDAPELVRNGSSP